MASIKNIVIGAAVGVAAALCTTAAIAMNTPQNDIDSSSIGSEIVSSEITSSDIATSSTISNAISTKETSSTETSTKPSQTSSKSSTSSIDYSKYDNASRVIIDTSDIKVDGWVYTPPSAKQSNKSN